MNRKNKNEDRVMPKAFERDKQAQDIAAEAGRKTSAEFEVPEDPVVLWTSESERDTQAIQDIADEAERKIEEARGNGFEANEDPVALWTSETYNVVGERETGVAPEVERKTDEGEGYGGGNVDGDGEEDQRRPLSRRSTPENHTHDIAAVSTFLDHFPTEGMDSRNQKAAEVFKSEGVDAAVQHMFTDDKTGRKLSYSEMRMRYG